MRGSAGIRRRGAGFRRPSWSALVSRVLRREQGSALVEFAASAILLFTVIFGIMDCCRALYTDHFIANAARDATRYAMVRGGSWSSNCATTFAYNCTASSSNVSSFVQSLATAGIKASSIVTTTTWPGTTASGASCTANGGPNSAGCVVSVNVAYTFNFVLPFLPKSGFKLTSTSEMTIVQ